ncbi:beta-1:3-galactosyltransferase 2-like protein, partial [Leptotrombidium deliense]
RYKTNNRIYNVIADKLESNGNRKEDFRFYSLAELQLSKRFLINKENICGPTFGAKNNLIIVFCSVEKPDNRKAIRLTWGGYLKKESFKLIILTANRHNVTINNQLIKEDNITNDIIQSSFDEDYYNETLKAISMIFLLQRDCKHVNYVLKTDEDMIVNPRSLLKVMKQYLRENKIILGLRFNRAKVVRNINSKWFVPKFIYPQKYFPNYISGAIYVLSGDCIAPMFNNLFKVRVYYIDDVYITGMIGEIINARLQHQRLRYHCCALLERIH